MDVCFLFSFFYFLVIMNNAAMNIYVQIFVWMYVLISLRYIPRSRVAESCVVTPCLTLWELSNVFQSSCTILHFHQQNINFPTSPQPHQHLLSFVIYIYIYIYIHTYIYGHYCHPRGCEVISHYAFDCVSLMTHDVEQIFLGLFVIVNLL